jgi:dTDP-glucose 4,6-dehydratase
MRTQGSAVVIGGAGFLGSHLVDRLLADGWSVLCLDNFVTGSKENLDHLEDEDAFTFIEHDIRRPLELDVELTVVWHLASLASPEAYLAKPIETLEVGSLGTANALELARKSNALFVFTSTSEVYGDPEVSPQPETYRGNVSPTGPRAVYDESKRYAEALTMTYHRDGLDVRIARIFNTYGPRLQPGDGRAVSNFIRQALADEPVTVYGDGSQTRSFCYVDDMIDGLIALSKGDLPGPMNIGNPDERTILDLAQLVIDKTGSSSEIRFLPLPEDDPQRRLPDISLAREHLGWEPKISLDDGIERTISWFEQI